MPFSRQNDTLLLNSELSEAQKRTVQRRVEKGELHRIAPGIATSLPSDQWEALIRREKTRIIGALFPLAVISHKSAFNALAGGTVYLTVPGRRREVDLPGLKIIAYTGEGPIRGDMPINGGNVYFPGQARMFLENMTRNDGNRNATREELEERALSICDIQGEDKLLALRNEMESIAVLLDKEKQASEFGKTIGAILGTRSAKDVSSAAVKAAADGYDNERIEKFDALISALRTTTLPSITDSSGKGLGLINFGFLESYFSNFIEGTEFEIDEARRIVLDGQISEIRPKDSHDIIGVFKQIVDPGWRRQTLSDSIGVVTQLQQRHLDLMKARPETRPGELKLQPNQAGNTSFVQPRLVKGTLIAGAKRLREIEPGLARALYAMFLVAEVHPFDDGNGRLARLAMNAELSQEGLCRIIIPTLYREIYFDGLRLLTREGDPRTFIKAMVDIQDWVSRFDFEDLDSVIETLTSCNAFEQNLNAKKLEFPVAIEDQDSNQLRPMR